MNHIQLKLNALPLPIGEIKADTQNFPDPIQDFNLIVDFVSTIPPPHLHYNPAHTLGGFTQNSLMEYDYAAYHVLRFFGGDVGEFAYQATGKVFDKVLGAILP